ncbi:MAG: pilus assembly protein PilM [Bacillota bacterium]|jgi:type IV pilus assembly protein PilM|nr:pilus assembly protein PilM [Bacillota bacterium]NLV61937.1 pilus assembly protein PilM [Clostridiaceae bacterium]
MDIFKKSVVGIEVDSAEIRAVHIEGKADRPNALAFAKMPLNKGIVQDGKVLDTYGLGAALSALWANENIKSRDVILGVNNHDVIVRFADYPKVPEDKLDGMIRFQSQEYIPIPLDEVELDYAVIGETVNDEGTFLKVLLVAGKKKMLFDFIASLQAARLNILDIGVSMLSVSRIVPEQIRNLPVAVVNLTNDFVNIVIMNKNEPGMARTFNYPSDMAPYVKEITARNNFSGRLENEVADGICDVLAGEIRSSVIYYHNQNPDAVFNNIILTGSLAKVKCISDKLMNLTETNVKAVSPSELGINLSRLDKGSSFTSDFAICTSLAIRGLEV